MTETMTREEYINALAQYRAEYDPTKRRANLKALIDHHDAQAATIADLRAALTEAHQHAEVLMSKLDEVTKESE